MPQLVSLRGMLSLGYGLEWWASAAIILAYVFITIYFWHDPEEPGFVVMLGLSLGCFVVCYVMSRLWSRMQMKSSAHKSFWADPAYPQRLERLDNIAHVFFGRFTLWIVAILGFGIVALAQIFTHRPYDGVIWLDVSFGLCVVLYTVCFVVDARHFRQAVDPKIARRAERARLRAEHGDDYIESSDDDDDEYGDEEGYDDAAHGELVKADERKRLLDSEKAAGLRTYAATDQATNPHDPTQANVTRA